MPGITGMGTTFNLPNYVGELFAVSPEDTPFLSAIGGLTGGRPANATHFTWSGYDLRDASAERQRVEGAAAPDAEARARFGVMNVVEIHQETIDTSYTKQAAVGQFGDLSANHPNVQGVSGTNAITDEHGWQIAQALKQIARDVEMSFIRGEYADPGTNAAPRRTRGLLEAIETHAVDAAGEPLTEDMILDLMQEVWSSGGIGESETATLMVGARQKRNLSRIFITDRNYREESRNVGGVSLQTIETDFGRLNLLMNRWMPADSVVVTSLEQCAPRFLPIPGKGFLFQESLAKIGASDRTQIYGEIGLEYGNEMTHGKITGLSTTGNGGGGGTTQVFVTGTSSALPVNVQGQPIEVVNSDAGAAALSVPTEGQGEVERPPGTASRATWEAYILATYNVSEDEAKGMTKGQLQALDADLSDDE